jgi:leucyl/phenylalanyl-tRNA--protein transferase
MAMAYTELFAAGFAHSVEVWQNDALVGGLYGVSLGRMFFGESMFSTATDASKIAFVALARQLQAWDFALIDCQLSNPHLVSMGAYSIPRPEFTDLLEQHATVPSRQGSWTLSWALTCKDDFQ